MKKLILILLLSPLLLVLSHRMLRTLGKEKETKRDKKRDT